ncbi:aminotransferase class IV family protein [Mesorhizobium sp. SP-1A]|uniref:aminotransferase class IV family protein n=1 Tax=Mesorhizobium sp. SP-1A TaxID=3077840 RepID=UPI0028F73C2F|nr:aminotransferase class IV family protein [Mesorhizobium sp. SP-1A]
MPLESTLRHGDGPGFELIETLRWQPDGGLAGGTDGALDGGFVRLERHLARLAASASALGFSCDLDRIAALLRETVGEPRDPQRVRLLLARDGHATVSTHPHEPTPEGRVWKVRVARTRLDSSDALLRHKTSRRVAYVRARAEFPAPEADEVLLANERGELCEGTFTSIFADFGDGILATPRLDCGLLAGVLRAEMLDEGHAYETVFGPEDLKSAVSLFVGNSLRGLVPATLA